MTISQKRLRHLIRENIRRAAINENDEHLRNLIREAILSDLMGGIASGARQVYDFASGLIGSEESKTGLLGYLDSLSPDEEDEKKNQTSYTPYTGGTSAGGESFARPTTGILVTPGSISVLVIGDSQAGSNLGKEIAGRFESQGVKTKIIAETGRSSFEIANRLESEIKGYDIVVAMFGGNDSNPSESVSSLEKMYDICQKSGAYLIVIGPPPATRITDLVLAKRVFGSSIENENSHIYRDGGLYADLRVSISEALDDASQGKPGISGFGIASRIPLGQYPDQPDGIHCREGAAGIADKIFAELGITNIINEIKEKSKKVSSPSTVPAVDSSPVEPSTPAPLGSESVVNLIRSRSTFNKINESHFPVIEIIERVLQSEGFTQMAILAAVANAWHESKLKPGNINHKEKGGRKSVGLFQLYDGGAGEGMSISERQDPVINTRKIADSAKKTRFMQYMREYPDDPRILAAAFCVLVERPGAWRESRFNRAETAGKLAGITGPLPSIIGSINLQRRKRKS